MDIEKKIIIHIALIAAIIGIITNLLVGVAFTSAMGRGVVTFLIFLALGWITFGLFVEANKQKPMQLKLERNSTIKKRKDLNFAPQVLAVNVSPPKKKKKISKTKKVPKFYLSTISRLEIKREELAERTITEEERLKKDAANAKEYLLQENPKKIADLIKGEWWNE